jgi:hypothetical protein
MPAKRTRGSSGSGMSFAPISISVASPPSLTNVWKYSSSSSQPLPGSMRPPYSANGRACDAGAGRRWPVPRVRRQRLALGGAIVRARRVVIASPSGKSTPQPTTSSTSARSGSRRDERRSTSVFQTMPAALGNTSCRCRGGWPAHRARSAPADSSTARPDAHHRRRVEVREEHEDVVLLMVALEVLDEPGAHGPCCFSHSISSLRLWLMWKIQSEYC